MSLHHTDVPHKPLWPLAARDGVALTCALIALAVAAFSGVGGGGVLLPIYILVLDFHLKEAVALTNATILGGAIANVWFASRKRHPYADRPLVAWDLILLFEPVVIFGSVLGSFANKLLPDVVLEIILVLLYGTLSYQTMSRAVQLVEEEGGWRYLCKRLPPTAMNSPAAPATPARANPFNDTPMHVQVSNDDRNESKNDVDMKSADESTPLCMTSSGSDDDASYHSASCTLDKDDSFYNLPPPNTPDSKEGGGSEAPETSGAVRAVVEACGHDAVLCGYGSFADRAEGCSLWLHRLLDPDTGPLTLGAAFLPSSTKARHPGLQNEEEDRLSFPTR